MLEHENNKEQYEADGMRRAWDYTFRIFDNNQIEVFVKNPQGLEAHIKENFYIDTAKKQVIYPSAESGLAPLSKGYQITLLRKIPLIQDFKPERNGAFDASMAELTWDKLMAIVQDFNEKIGRAVLNVVSDTNPASSSQGFLERLQKFMTELQALNNQSLTAAQAAQNAADNAQTTAGSAIADINTAENAAVVAVETARDGALGDIIVRGSDIINEAQGYAAAAGEEANNADISAQNAAFYAEAAGETVFAVTQELDNKADKDLSNVEGSVVRAKANRVWRSPFYNYNTPGAWISFNHGLTAEELADVKEVVVVAEVIKTNTVNLPVGLKIRNPPLVYSTSVIKSALVYYDNTSIRTVTTGVVMSVNNFTTGASATLSTTENDGYFKFWVEIIY